ncbi:MAG: uroporphyrinogen-III synthase [Gammaproteobacteria bacterium]
MKTLKGLNVLVTRPSHQADNLCSLIESQGGRPIRLPTIEIVGERDTRQIVSTLKNLDKFQWLVFISVNAVNFALNAISGKIGFINSVKIAAIGQTTAKELKRAGLAVDLLPERGFDSDALLAMPQMQSISGQRFLIVRGGGGREVLADNLRKRGAEVEYLNVYRRILPRIDCLPTIHLLNENKIDVVTATSVEALENLLKMLGEKYYKQLINTPLVVVSDRIAQMAAEKGFNRIFIANGPTDTAILETVTTCTTGEHSGRSK